MNSIVLPMKVHAVKLEYRRLKLEKMLQGRFKTVRGKQYVLISKDPAMPRFNTRHPRILNVATELGRKYSESITEYQKKKLSMMSFLMIGIQDTVLLRQE